MRTSATAAAADITAPITLVTVLQSPARTYVHSLWPFSFPSQVTCLFDLDLPCEGFLSIRKGDVVTALKTQLPW